MDVKKLREVFCGKISNELEVFHLKKLQEEPEDIYDSAFEINCVVTLYEVLVEMSEQMGMGTLQTLIMTPDLLFSLYEGWLETEDEEWEHMQEFIKEQVSMEPDFNETGNRKGRKNEAFSIFKRAV